jgi:PAS domain S-box-containing protein
MTAERHAPSEQLARAIDRAVYASLRPVLASLALLFFMFAVAHPLVLEPGAAIPMAMLAGLTSFAFLGLFGALQAGRLQHRPALFYSLVIAAFVLANCLAHLHLVGNPGDTTNLLLFIVGAGFLLLSTRWLLICILVTFLGFYLVALEHPPFARWASYIFALVSAAVLSLLVHVVRLRTVTGFEGLRHELEDMVEERTRSLASERNLLRTLVDSLPDGVFVKDTAGRYRIANAAHRRQLGVGTSEELAHRTVSDLVPGHWATAEAAEDRRIIDSGTPVVDREQSVTTGDTTAWLLTSKVPVTDPAGMVVGLVGVARDVTAMREAAQARRQLDQQLQETQKLESLGVLAGGIAHDFNNLLTGILGNISLARMSLDSAPQTRVYLEGIETAAERAADLCQQMLAYAGKGRFHEQRLDLGALVTDMMPLLRLSVAKGVTLRLEVAPGLPAIWADPTQMRQIVLNLVVNGSDAIADAGAIHIRVRAASAEDPLLAETVPPLQPGAAGAIVLDVIDTGCGMTADMQARVFEPFFTTKFTGRGLGLAVVHGIVRGHRGGLRVESAPRRGSRFTVAIPAIAGPPEPLERLAPPSGVWRGSGVALVADDEDVVREVTQAMLEELGFRVVAVTNGQEAVDAFAREPGRFAVVLLDLTMPVLNGADALRAIRAIAPGTRVLMMSGFNELETSDRFVGVPPDAFIHKPFALANLRERLQSMLNA